MSMGTRDWILMNMTTYLYATGTTHGSESSGEYHANLEDEAEKT